MTADDDAFARRLRGFGPAGILSLLAILAGNFLFTPLSALLVLAWARLSRTPWADLGFVRPKRWPVTLALGIVCGVAFKLSMKALVMPLLGASPVNAAYHYLAGNTAALPGMLYSVVVGAGFGEEVVFRGYLFERLGRWLGSGAAAKVAIVLFTAALFGAVHYPIQGRDGVVQAGIVGLVFGGVFALTRRLWPLIIAHAAFDITAGALIYFNLETRVAHLILR